MTAPPDRWDVGGASRQTATTRVLDRLRVDAGSDAVVVDRLNALSLLAALHGKTYSPHTVMVSARSLAATPPTPALPPSLP